MEIEMRNFVDFLFSLLFLAMLTQQGSAQDCLYTNWTLEDTPCPAEHDEIYKEVHLNENASVKLCCVPGSDEAIASQRAASNCRATKCVSTNSSDSPCSTLLERYINGRKLKYKEVIFDPCTIYGDGGEQGIVSLCCQPNSIEATLVTAYGAEDNEFPHQSKLKRSDAGGMVYNCGGTIYNKRFIITASHCIVDQFGNVTDASNMEVVLGTNIADADTVDYVYYVARIIPHENYSKLAGQPEFGLENSRFFNDIALLELNRDIQFSDNIKALEMAPEEFDPFQYADKAVIVGWGTTDILAPAIHLQKANFLLRPDAKCFANDSDKYTYMSDFENQLLCLGGIMDGTWSYTAGGGDSGGPAICRNKYGYPVICGVTSFGGPSDIDCVENPNEENCFPSVYADVSHFRSWIIAHAGPQDSELFYRPYLYGKEIGLDGYTEYNYHVHITSTTGKNCGGTLIAPDVVITAAQCVVKSFGGKKHVDLKVITGIVDLNYDTGETFGVKTILLQPGFQREPVSGGKRGNHILIADYYFRNGLAIVKLNDTVSISPDKLPILPAQGQVFEFGEEIAFPRNTSRSGKMMSREYRLLNLHDCQTRMKRMPKAILTIKLENNILCGVEKFSGGSTCDRELGGGLYCKGNGRKKVLCGVQIFRLCELSIPNGFINMALHSDWVREKVNDKKCESLLCDWFTF